MTHAQRRVFVLEYEDPHAQEGWSVLMCNTARSVLVEHQKDLPKSTRYRIEPYAPTTKVIAPSRYARRSAQRKECH